MVGSKYSYETGNGVGGRKTFGDSDETVPASPPARYFGSSVVINDETWSAILGVGELGRHPLNNHSFWPRTLSLSLSLSLSFNALQLVKFGHIAFTKRERVREHTLFISLPSLSLSLSLSLADSMG